MKAFDFSAENLELNDSKMFCIIDGNRGVYIPFIFADRYGQYCVKGLSKEDLKILLSGRPDCLEYWNVWEEVVNEVEFLFDGQLCTLYEDGCLFAVPI